MAPALDIAQLSDVSGLPKDQQVALLKLLAESLGTEAVTVSKDAVKARSDRETEETFKWFETTKADLIARFEKLLNDWITANKVERFFKFSISNVVIDGGKVQGAIEMKAARGTQGVLTGKPAAPRNTQSLAAYIGDVKTISYSGTVYGDWEKLRVALNVPMPARESATRTLVKVAGGKAGETESGGVVITQEMIDAVRAVEVTAEKVSGTLGEITDAIKAEKAEAKANGHTPATNGAATTATTAAAPANPTT